jgi:hypothetical protein
MGGSEFHGQRNQTGAELLSGTSTGGAASDDTPGAPLEPVETPAAVNRNDHAGYPVVAGFAKVDHD